MKKKESKINLSTAPTKPPQPQKNPKPKSQTPAGENSQTPKSQRVRRTRNQKNPSDPNCHEMKSPQGRIFTYKSDHPCTGCLKNGHGKKEERDEGTKGTKGSDKIYDKSDVMKCPDAGQTFQTCPCYALPTWFLSRPCRQNNHNDKQRTRKATKRNIVGK